MYGILLGLSFLLAACQVGDEIDGSSRLVVEGWIDDGDFPIVKVSHSITLGKNYVSLKELDKYVERWALVTINDGKHTETMVGRYDKRHNPPFVYTTAFMRGQAGKTYRLSVITPDGSRAEAVTTIPQPVWMDSFQIEPVQVGDSTLYQVYGYTSYRGPCKLFTRVEGEETEYLSAYLGIYDSTMLAPDGCMSVSRGRSMFVKKFTPYFKDSTVVDIKFATLGDEAFRYWRKFEDQVTLSYNPFFPATDNLPSNIRGGLGYWFGYGATYCRLPIGRAALPETPARRPAY